MELLLQNGANPDKINQHGDTVLKAAIESGNFEF